MQHHENLQQEIEAYLNSEMSPDEMVAFEQKMAKDPLIRQELELQQAIIAGLRESRIAALKAGLNSVPVGLAPTLGAITAKIAAVIGIAGTIGVGAFYLYKTSETQPKKLASSQQIQTGTKTEVAQGESDAAIPSNASTESPEVENSISIQAEKNKVEESKADFHAVSPFGKSNKYNPSVKKETNASKDQIVESKNLIKNLADKSGKVDLAKDKENSNQVQEKESKTNTTYNLKAETEARNSGNSNLVDGDVSLNNSMNSTKPVGEINASDGLADIKPEVFVKKYNKDNYFYQFFNNKLVLFGDFENIVYELIELNNNNGKSLYIYFGEKFYRINQPQNEMAQLKVIKDPTLVKELNLLRKKRVE